MMKWLKNWSQYYVNLLNKLGLVQFSGLVAFCIIVLSLAIQFGITFAFEEHIHVKDLLGTLFFSLIITPWAVYFLSMVVEQQEISQRELRALLDEMAKLRERDLLLNNQLHENIQVLNLEIEERRKAKKARKLAMEELKAEVQRRKEAQHSVEERSALLRSFFDSSPDLIYYRDEQGCFSGCNKAMEVLIGRSESQLRGLKPHDVYEQNVAAKVVDTDQQVLESNEAVTYELWLQYPDGRKALFELRKVPLFSADGLRLGLLGFGRDVTERRKYAEKLEKASQDKTQFIATISHELRTPLNGIVGLSRILLDTQLEQNQRKHLKTIYASAETLGNIFNDIIDLDKLERRRLVIAAKPIDLPDFFDDIESLATLQSEQKGLALIFERQENLPEYVEADSTRLRQVLWNLVGNAVKFTEQGEIHIRLAFVVTGGFLDLKVDVEDSGIGIPEDKLEKIFAMYYQVEGTQKATGTGIGLAVSRDLMRIMGGNIEVKSRVNHGSCFSLLVRLAICGKAILPRDIPQPKLHILLVEDVELNVTVATALLTKLGHQVSVAMTGEQALLMISKNNYELILLDIRLPDMSGFDIVASLREQYSDTSLPPIVALTANVIRDKSEYFERGLDDAISKPISIDAITGVIGRLFLPNWCDEPQQDKTEKNDLSRYEQRLDLDLLEQYRDTIGEKCILDSVNLFEKVLPEYLAVLDSNMIARDQDGIVNETHKIKGAAGSIGLKYIQQIAQKAQSPDLPAWWDNIDDWVEILKRDYSEDVALLKQWLKE